MHLLKNKGIDDEVIVNLDLVRRIAPGYITAGDDGCHTIRVTYGDGSSEHLRYVSEACRDLDLGAICMRNH